MDFFPLQKNVPIYLKLSKYQTIHAAAQHERKKEREGKERKGKAREII